MTKAGMRELLAEVERAVSSAGRKREWALAEKQKVECRSHFQPHSI